MNGQLLLPSPCPLCSVPAPLQVEVGVWLLRVLSPASLMEARQPECGICPVPGALLVPSSLEA